MTTAFKSISISVALAAVVTTLRATEQMKDGEISDWLTLFWEHYKENKILVSLRAEVVVPSKSVFQT